MKAPAAAVLLLGLAACATPVSRPPPVDRERAEAEARLQHQLVNSGMVRWHRNAPRGDAVDRDLADFDRLATIGWRVLRGAVELCPDRRERQAGALFGGFYDGIPETLRPAYAERFGVENDPMVMGLATNAPAHRAGLKVGDYVVAVDGEALPPDGKGLPFLLDKLSRDAPSRLTLKRAGQTVEATVAPEAVCGARLRFDRWAGANAYADGRHVTVSAGLLRNVGDDDQLATVIGHELAHNTMGHLDKQAENAKAASRVGTFLKVLTGAPEVEGQMAQVGSRAFSQSFEAEADYVGLYLAAAAGFDPTKAPAFWRRMALLNPATITHAVSHPTSPARFVALEDTAREIADKRARGLPLVPELK